MRTSLVVEPRILRRTLVVRAAQGLEEEVARQVRIPVGRGFAGRIAHGRRPVKIDDVDRADIYNPILREKGLKSLLGVPLLLETRVIGVLHVGTLTPRSFGDEDVEVLQRAADRAALSIGVRLAESERGLVDAFQRSLIPPLPMVSRHRTRGQVQARRVRAARGRLVRRLPPAHRRLGRRDRRRRGPRLPRRRAHGAAAQRAARIRAQR